MSGNPGSEAPLWAGQKAIHTHPAHGPHHPHTSKTDQEQAALTCFSVGEPQWEQDPDRVAAADGSDSMCKPGPALVNTSRVTLVGFVEDAQISLISPVHLNTKSLHYFYC